MNNEEKRIDNFNNMIKDVEKDIDKEIEFEKQFAEENYNEKSKIKSGIISKMWKAVTMSLLRKFKIKITLFYNDKIVFEYEIPKN